MTFGDVFCRIPRPYGNRGPGGRSRNTVKTDRCGLKRRTAALRYCKPRGRCKLPEPARGTRLQEGFAQKYRIRLIPEITWGLYTPLIDCDGVAFAPQRLVTPALSPIRFVGISTRNIRRIRPLSCQWVLETARRSLLSAGPVPEGGTFESLFADRCFSGHQPCLFRAKTATGIHEQLQPASGDSSHP